MRRLSLILAIFLCFALPLGCVTAQRTAPKKTEPKITPGVKTVTFTSVEPVRAPDSVQLLLEKNKTKDTATLVNAGQQDIYILATSAKNKLRLRQVTNTVTTTGQNQLRVVIERTDDTNQSQASGLAPTALAKLNFNQAPDAVSFEYVPVEDTTPRSDNAAPRSDNNKTAPAPAPAAKPDKVTITVTEPRTGAEVQSPFSVSGKVNGKAQLVRIRLLKGTEVLDSKEAAVNQKGVFQQSMQYPKQDAPMAGTLEILVPNADMNPATIPLTLK